MSDACALAAGPPSLARDLLASVDCFIATRVESGYAQLLAPGGMFSTALTIALTIYVAIYGYRLVLGTSSLALRDIVPRFLKIGLVLAAVTSWPAYQKLAFNLLFEGPQQVASAVMGNSSDGSSRNVVTSLQSVFDELTDYAGDAWGQRGPAVQVQPPATPVPVAEPSAAPATQSSPFTPDPATANAMKMAPNVPTKTAPTTVTTVSQFALGPAQFVALALWASALLMFATSIGLLLIVRIILGILLLFGPVFIALALFGLTRSLFEGWLRASVKFALAPLIVLPLSGVLVVVLAPFVGKLQPGPILAFRDTPALAILAIVVVFSVVLSQALSLTGTIAGAIRLPRSAVGAVPVSSSTGQMLPPTTVAQPSRAEVIAGLAPVTPARGIGVTSTQGEAVVAGRRFDMPPGPAVAPAEYAGRLGQATRREPPRTSFASSIRYPTG